VVQVKSAIIDLTGSQISPTAISPTAGLAGQCQTRAALTAHLLVLNY